MRENQNMTEVDFWNPRMNKKKMSKQESFPRVVWIIDEKYEQYQINPGIQSKIQISKAVGIITS